jgi:hypothetical protein
MTSRIAMYLGLFFLLRVVFLRLTRLRRGFPHRDRIVSPNSENLQSDEYTTDGIQPLAEEVIDVELTTGITNPVSRDVGSSTMRRRHTAFTKNGLDIISISEEISLILRDVRDGVADLLANDPFINELCSIAVSNFDGSKFDRNFRRMFRIYQSDLEQEAHTEEEKLATRFIGLPSICHYIGAELRDRITIQDAFATECSLDLRKGRLARYLLKALGPHGNTRRNRSPADSITRFLTESTAFWNLREELRRFLFPSAWNMYQDGMRDIICHNKPKMITAGVSVKE